MEQLTIQVTEKELAALDQYRQEFGERLTIEEVARLLLTDKLKGAGFIEINLGKE